MQNPKISIIMPNYNYAQYIKEALDSLVNQTYKNFEVVIIDDCSTDQSLDCILPYVKKDDRFFLIQNKVNSGCHYSASQGLKKISGDYVFGFSSDDRILPNFLEKKAEAIKNNPDIGLFCSLHTYFFDEEPDKWLISPKNPSQTCLILKGKSLIDQIKTHRFFIPGNTTVVKKDLLDQFGGFEEKYGSHTDWFTYHQIAFKHGCYFIPESLSLMRIHRKSLSKTEPIERKKKVWRSILNELSKKKHKEIKKAFVRSHIFNTFGTPFFEFILKNPKYWPFFKLHVYKHFYKRWKKAKVTSN